MSQLGNHKTMRTITTRLALYGMLSSNGRTSSMCSQKEGRLRKKTGSMLLGMEEMV